MKNKKGFTLIELLAVIGILGVIITIAGVSVSKLMQNSKKDINKIQEKAILSAAKAYTADNLSSCKSGCVVSTDTLISSGYLDNSESISGQIVVTKDGNKFNYEYTSTVISGDDSINITNFEPITRNNVLTNAVKKTFKVKNSLNKKMYAKITLNNIEISNRLKNYDFVWSLYEGNKNVSNGTFDNVGENITLGEYLVLESNEEKTYNLYIWLEKTSVGQSSISGQFSATIQTNLENYYTSPESDFVVNSNGVLTAYTGSPGIIIIPPVVNGVTVTKIGIDGNYSSILPDSGAFAEANTTIVIPNTVTKISSMSLFGSGVDAIIIPNSVTEIGIAAIGGNNYTNISIPNSVTTLGSEAVASNNLKSIFIPNTVTKIDGQAFANNNLKGIIIPSSVTNVSADETGLFWYNGDDNLIIIVQGKSSAPDTFYEGWNKKTYEGTETFNTVYVP
ncbi:MAG: leucine-rich repeat protein [Bacilli bacterium]|nr:leucine-rich repeat protein [Bacilli bacterium]